MCGLGHGHMEVGNHVAACAFAFLSIFIKEIWGTHPRTHFLGKTLTLYLPVTWFLLVNPFALGQEDDLGLATAGTSQLARFLRTSLQQ